MNIQPLADRVLIKPAAAEEKIGGIIIPDTAKEKPLKGEVLAVGKGTKVLRTRKWSFRLTTLSYTVNTLAQSWSLTERNISSCVSQTFLLLSSNIENK